MWIMEQGVIDQSHRGGTAVKGYKFTGKYEK